MCGGILLRIACHTSETVLGLDNANSGYVYNLLGMLDGTVYALNAARGELFSPK